MDFLLLMKCENSRKFQIGTGQNVCDRQQATGLVRNISRTYLPAGKGPATRSDIDVRIDGQVDINTGGRLSHEISNISKGIGKSLVLIGDEPSLPAIMFKPAG